MTARLIHCELSGWKPLEIAWLLVATLTILGLSIHWNSSWMECFAAVSGVICVILTGKGKLLTYAFGSVNSLLYALIAWDATYSGETMLNLFYYLPMNIVGFFVWKKHIDGNTHEVKKKLMCWKDRIFTLSLLSLGTIAYGFLLKHLSDLFSFAKNDALPFVDSFTTVCSIVATVISIKRYVEQWLIWIVVDVFTVYMWWVDYMKGESTLSILLMWSIYLLNAVIMFAVWIRKANQDINTEANT